jgi:hypothetical protein
MDLYVEVHDLPNFEGRKDCWLSVNYYYYDDKEYQIIKYHYSHPNGCYLIEHE